MAALILSASQVWPRGDAGGGPGHGGAGRQEGGGLHGPAPGLAAARAAGARLPRQEQGHYLQYRYTCLL